MAGRLLTVETVLIGVVLALVAMAAYCGIGGVLAERALTDRTAQTLTVISDLRGELDDAQRGERGYALTADEHDLQPYTTAVAQVSRSLVLQP